MRISKYELHVDIDHLFPTIRSGWFFARVFEAVSAANSGGSESAQAAPPGRDTPGEDKGL